MDPRTRLNRCGSLALTGIRSPDRPARSQSLYRVRYPAHFVTSELLKTEPIRKNICKDTRGVLSAVT